MTIARMTAASLASLSLPLASIVGALAPTSACAQFDTASEAAAYYEEELDDIEWEAGEGYHEEEWYDPSDWFDLDQGVEYEHDYADTYGYSDDADDWYYDYYDADYFYDDYGDNDGIYSSSSHYYDYDNDGVYEAYTTYYDWDGDGLYEDYNYYSFTSLEDADDETSTAEQEAQQRAQQQQQQQQQQQKKKSSKRYQVSGEVQQTKKVQVRHGHNLVAHVKAEQGTYIVDLGSAEQASDWNVAEGTQIAARGPVIKVGDKQVLLAKHAKIGQNEASIDRSTAKVTGTIASLKKVSVRGTEHQFALVDSKDKQKKVLVEMGPADKLTQDFAEGDEITARGMPLRVNERPVLVAQKVDYQNETITIDRREKQQQN